MKKILSAVLLCALCSCQELFDAPVPDLHWAPFDATTALPLSTNHRKALEGVYTIGEAADDFGKEAALKWSYIVAEKDTTYYLSFFCSEDVRYFICRGKKAGDAILLNGYWRNIENTKTGKAHFTITAANGAKEIFNGVGTTSKLLISGTYGRGDEEPENKISFSYQRPLYAKQPYTIIAHRGGGRNNDLLPASENSVQIIQLAAQLGASGIEIDVQLTKDSVPVLFHDSNIDDRLTTRTGIHGTIDSYTWNELNKEVNLKRGGKIPTLKQALETVLYQTPLELVWLDCKYKEGLPVIHALQEEYTKKAKQAGRKLLILIGLPDKKVWDYFLQLPDHRNIPSLCELDTAKTSQAGAIVWASGWIKGHEDEEVKAMQAKGKQAFVWTVDIPDKIKEFIYESKFNGIVTNRPTMAAYYYYARQ